MRSLEEFAAGRVDEDAVFFCCGAAGQQATLPTHAPVPAKARRTPSGKGTIAVGDALERRSIRMFFNRQLYVNVTHFIDFFNYILNPRLR